MQISNKTYDFLNALVRYILPALGTLYFTLSEIWGFPNAAEVVGTISAAAMFGGLVIALARNKWKEPTDGTLLIDETDPTLNSFGFEGGKRLEEFRDNEVVKLKVNKIMYEPTPETYISNDGEGRE